MPISFTNSAAAKQPAENLDSFLSSVIEGIEADAKNTELDFNKMIYSGFDAETIRNLARNTFAPAGLLRLVAIGALRGSAAVSKKAASGGDPNLHGIKISMKDNSQISVFDLFRTKKLYAEKRVDRASQKFLNGPCTAANHLTVQRLVAAFPDMAAYALLTLEANGMLTPRVDANLPAWLMFPAAAALPFADEHIPAVKDMCKKFSELIGGQFDESIFELQRRSFVPFGNNTMHDDIMQTASNYDTPINFITRS
jgi:hypothetical protein